MVYAAVVFDLDYTLVEIRREYAAGTFIHTFKELGYDCSEEDGMQLWNGDHDRRDFILSVGITTQDFWRVYHKYDRLEQRLLNASAYPDSSVVKDLNQKGYKIGVVTGSSDKIARAQLKLVEGSFDSVVSVSSRFPGQTKPNPIGLLACLQELGVNSDDAIYVGNADEDILMAQNACVPGVLIQRDGYIPRSRPSRIITDLSQLLEIVK